MGIRLQVHVWAIYCMHVVVVPSVKYSKQLPACHAEAASSRLQSLLCSIHLTPQLAVARDCCEMIRKVRSDSEK